jgi:hypothetical protein
MLIGAIAAILGVILIWSALQTGSISLSYGSEENLVSEIVSRTADAARYWQLVAGLGIAPAVLGLLAAIWGWRAINR